MFLKKTPPGPLHSSIQPPTSIPEHLIPRNRVTPVEELKELAMRPGALVSRPALLERARITDFQSALIPEDEELSNFPNVRVINTNHERHRKRAGLPRINGHESANHSISSVRRSRSVLQAFNPIYLFEKPAESTAIKKEHRASIPGAKPNGLIKGLKQKMRRNVPLEDDETSSSDSGKKGPYLRNGEVQEQEKNIAGFRRTAAFTPERVYEDLPVTICEEYIANSSLSSTDDIKRDPWDKGDNAMSKEKRKGMAPKAPRTPTPKKAPENSPRLSDPKEEFVDHFKELCELMSHSQMVQIPCRQEPRVPAAARPLVDEPKKEEKKISLSEWSVKAVETSGICVEGRRPELDFHSWHSNVIVQRIQSDLLKTMTGSMYQLMGDADTASMSDFGYPTWLITKFSHGFPEDWKSYVRYFCEVAERLVDLWSSNLF
ncbi:uncharacterized protein [Phyllobates terribilis]|uniref:uncharacterized protein n=1 Tax=Phyllobates terribilis TaxID=111132 RepID=UPI003CCB5B3E